VSQIRKSLLSGPVPPDIATMYTEDSGTAVPDLNNLNVLGGAGIETVGLGDTITIIAATGGFAWSETSVSFGAIVQNGYYCNDALTVTLPATAGLLIGDTIKIYVDTSNTVEIQANTGQRIQIGQVISIAGGTADSNDQGSYVELNFKPSDLTWHSLSTTGTWGI